MRCRWVKAGKPNDGVGLLRPRGERKRGGQVMEKLTTTLSAHDRVILFCVATAIDCAAVGITEHAMQSMAIRGFIAHNRESGAYKITDRGHATLTAILEQAGHGNEIRKPRLR